MEGNPTKSHNGNDISILKQMDVLVLCKVLLCFEDLDPVDHEIIFGQGAKHVLRSHHRVAQGTLLLCVLQGS